MEGRNAVDGVAADNGQVCHADMFFTFFPDDGHAPQSLEIIGKTGRYLLEEVVVDLVDDKKVPRQDAFHGPYGPFFQGLGKDGVIGVGKGLDCDVPGCIPGELFLIQQDAHEFGYG